MSYATLSVYNTSLSDTETMKTHGFHRSNPSMTQPTMRSAELLYPDTPSTPTPSVSTENYASDFVRELTDKTIASVKDAPALTMFYASWCGHCTHFRPIYEEASRLAKETQVNVEFTAIECGTYTNVASEFNVRGFPTVILFKNGNQFVYEGKRVSSDIVDWIKNTK